MNTDTKKPPMKGDIYVSTQMDLFEVTSVFALPNEDEPWVEYMNSKTKTMYTCKQDAFLARFTHRTP